MHERQAWNILRIAPNREFGVAGHLIINKLVHYLPVYRTRIGKGRSARVAVRPLFPGYVFIGAGQEGAGKAVYSIPGCYGYLAGFEGPKSLSGAAVALVRQLEEDLNTAFTTKASRRGWNFKPGDKVTVCRKYHPFDGIDAILQRLDKRDRAILLLMVPGRAMTVSVSAQWLKEAATA